MSDKRKNAEVDRRNNKLKEKTLEDKKYLKQYSWIGTTNLDD